MRSIYIGLAVVLLFTACGRDKKDLLIRNWHAVSLDNPQLTDMIHQQQLFIDTVGTHTNAGTNAQAYGTNNIDSLKKALQSQLDSSIIMQKTALDNTWFNFKKNGSAYLTFNGATDSAKWSFDDEGSLILDDLQYGNSGDKLSMKVVQLSDTVLKLRFIQHNINSVVTFHPEKN